MSCTCWLAKRKKSTQATARVEILAAILFVCLWIPVCNGTRTNNRPSSLLELQALLQTANSTSLPQCLAMLRTATRTNRTGELDERLLRAAMQDVVGALNDSLEYARTVEDEECEVSLTRTCMGDRASSHCCKDNSSLVCQQSDFSNELFKLRERSLWMFSSNACQPSDGYITMVTLNACSRAAGNLVASARDLLVNLTSCLDNITSEAGDNESSTPCPCLLEGNALLTRLTSLDHRLKSNQALAGFMQEANLTLTLVDVLITSVRRNLQPKHSTPFRSVEESMASVLCFGAVSANASNMTPLCQQECGKVEEIFNVLAPFMDTSKDDVLRLVGDASLRYCTYDITSHSICFVFNGSGADTDTFEVQTNSSAYIQLATQNQPNFCFHMSLCLPPLKETSTPRHRFPPLVGIVHSVHARIASAFPNLTNPINDSFALCGLHCSPDIQPAVVVAFVTYCIAFFASLVAVSVFVRFHSTLHLGRRLSGWICLYILVGQSSAILAFFDVACHSDGTTRFDEPTEANLCSVSAIFDLLSPVAATPFMLGVAYSFHRLVKLTGRIQRVRRDLVENVGKVEALFVLSGVVLCVPYASVIIHFRLIHGDSNTGMCMVDNKPVLSSLMAITATISLVALVTIATGLPKFLHLLKLSKDLRRVVLRPVATSAVNGTQEKQKKEKNPTRMILMEIGLFMVICGSIMIALFVIYLLTTFEERRVRRVTGEFVRCVLSSCNPVRDCTSATTFNTDLIVVAHILFHVLGFSLSLWAFRSHYWKSFLQGPKWIEWRDHSSPSITTGTAAGYTANTNGQTGCTVLENKLAVISASSQSRSSEAKCARVRGDADVGHEASSTELQMISEHHDQPNTDSSTAHAETLSTDQLSSASTESTDL